MTTRDIISGEIGSKSAEVIQSAILCVNSGGFEIIICLKGVKQPSML